MQVDITVRDVLFILLYSVLDYKKCLIFASLNIVTIPVNSEDIFKDI